MGRCTCKLPKLAVRIPPNAIKIPLPDFRQPENYSCALAFYSVARYFGVGPEDHNEFKEKLGITTDGTYYGNIVRYANELGFTAFAQQEMTKRQLIRYLDSGIPVILSMQAWSSEPESYSDPDIHDSGHYINAVGYWKARRRCKCAQNKRSKEKAPLIRQTYFYFMDPSIGCQRGVLEWNELKMRWHEDEDGKGEIRRQLGIVLNPNGMRPVYNTIARHID